MRAFKIESRIEAFSDAVFGFAATLLVVSLEVPKSFELLTQQLKGFASFGLSFLALVLIWFVHYNFFRRVNRFDNWILAFNMILLFLVLYFVYPLKFLTNMLVEPIKMQPEEFSLLFQLYSLGFLAIFLTIALMYFRAGRNEQEPFRKSMLNF
ncbi:MAG: TMEM175 family protein [Saprospiraceae bacterium]